ncbi:Oidioi.mRNA.OKI2018_I69.chr1.g2240.t1.cds [Oikopleura dioica]|uniref:Oidioi.mRNA.OKI2018_I69.chr1.g2240.t1.cds n=1 Tax=Oikopleura dioica TaxID=34765 RepID=A0ABN7SU23_OIKDI|nr:Oidioi.mRNA.OKI2018_I69.chr1.g2240.t1.cds [Oikopleura dioica]
MYCIPTLQDIPELSKDVLKSAVLYAQNNVPRKTYLVLASFCGAAVIGYLWVQQKWKYWERKGVPGPKPSFKDIGNTRSTFRDHGTQLGKDFPMDAVGIYIFGVTPALVIRDPVIWKEVCVKKFHNFTTGGRTSANYLFGKISPDFLTVAEGPKWKRLRSTIAPFFSGNNLKEICLIINDLFEYFDEKFIPENDETDVNAKDFASNFSLRAILASGFAINAKENEELAEDLYKHASILFEVDWKQATKSMMLPKWLRFKLNVTSYPHSTDVFFRNIISDIIENGKKNGKKNLITLMAENIIDESEELTASKGFTKGEILAQALIFQFAGQDTTANVLSFFLFALSHKPELQDEIRGLLEETDLSYDGLKKVKFLDACIKETQRYFTFLFFLREADEDCEVAGVKVEKGSSVMFLPKTVHRNPDYYPNPDAFDPHRFDNNESNTLQDDYWFGFGIGPRACPAVRWAFVAIKIFIANVLVKYDVLPGENAPAMDEVNALFRGAKVTTNKPMPIRFRKRS